MTAQCLQLDVGNSSAKWRLLDINRPGQIIARGCYNGDEPSRHALLGCTDVLDHIWIGSVADAHREQQLVELLRQRWSITPWFARSQAQTGRLINSYEQPERMGADRWLAMLGGQQHSSGRFCVVDAGSALTIDIVAASGQHEGGYIIPGPALMERALLLDTDRVRFDEAPNYALPPGRSTAQAVRHGIALAQAGSVALALQRENISGDELLWCGGASATLRELMGNIGRLWPDLVFDGLAVMAADAKK